MVLTMQRARPLSNEWLKDAAPWAAAVIAPILAWAATRRKTIVEADVSLRTDLRETEKYLRSQLRDLEANNRELTRENLELRQANLTLKAEFDDFKRDTAREIASLKDQLRTALMGMERGRQAREQIQEEVTALTERVRQGEPDGHEGGV